MFIALSVACRALLARYRCFCFFFLWTGEAVNSVLRLSALLPVVYYLLIFLSDEVGQA